MMCSLPQLRKEEKKLLPSQLNLNDCERCGAAKELNCCENSTILVRQDEIGNFVAVEHENVSMLYLNHSAHRSAERL